MIKNYKIGNFTITVRAQGDFQDGDPFSLFLCDGQKTDFCVDVVFAKNISLKTNDLFYDSPERVGVFENNQPYFYYKSHDNDKEYYAYRTIKENNISIAIDEAYRDKLSARVIFSLLGIEELVAEKNGCILHSSFIDAGGKAVLFTGPCSIGKSTQARLWRDYADAIVINGDKTLIFEENGIYYASGLPYSGSSKDCLNRVLPLGAVVCLKQSLSNSARRLESTDAFYSFYKNCYPVPSREHTGKALDFALGLSQSIPVYEFSCLADESAVRCLERELCPVLQSL